MAANETVYRYPNDVEDRIWNPQFSVDWDELYSSDAIVMDQSAYQLPSVVMSTAATPTVGKKYLNFSWVPAGIVDKNASYHIYMHFAEVSKIRNSRQLNVTVNGELISKPFDPPVPYLSTRTIYIPIAAEGGRYDFSISSPPNDLSYRAILNANEIYMGKEFSVLETNQQDVEAITNLKSTYKISKNWQGDPCYPQVYLWEGVECSYSENDSARIISLDLSSSGLTGEIADSIANLTMIKTLDLSDNKLSGQIPEYLSKLPNLKILNLGKNELTGSVPAGLIAKMSDGLSLSLCGNPSLTGQVPCKKKKSKFVIPVVVSIIGILLLSSIAAAKWYHAKYWSGKGAITESEMEQNRKGHDVFLSFRGEDTRTGFARNLHDTLDRNGIKTFFDDQNLSKGDEIGPTLVDAIEASEISIILFSENYVTSSWCLGELAHIVDCKRKNKDRRIIPVFYKVNPSDIRKQSASFCLDKWTDNADVPVWKDALREVANYSGYPYNDGYEIETIDKIVKDISDFMEDKKQKSFRRFNTIRPPHGEDKIVIYTTSSARDSNFQNCESMLQNLSDLKVQVRDVSIRKYRKELKKLMKEKLMKEKLVKENLVEEKLPPPRLFVNGKYVGGYDEVTKLMKEEPWFRETLKKVYGVEEVPSLPGPDVVQQAVEDGPVSEIDEHGDSPV